MTVPNTLKQIFYVTALFSICLVTLIITGLSLYLNPQLPSVESLRTIKLQTPLQIFSSDKKLIAEFGEKRRTPINIQDVPNLFVNAILAAEDDRFEQHHGVDIKSLMRAALQLVATGNIQTGGSTITMQVAKNYFLSRERTFSRKFNEILLALQIEQALSKEEILELYVNKIYLGNRAYGIQAAAQVYYGKEISELNLAQLAMIAGLPKAPSKFNPIANPERALQRRDWILQRMIKLKQISQTEYDEAIAQPITAKYHGLKPELYAPYVAEMVRQDLYREYGEDIYRKGFEVTTSILSENQQVADKALTNGLENYYDKRHGYRGTEGHVSVPDGEDANTYWLEALDSRATIGNQVPAIVSAIGERDIHALRSDGSTVAIAWDGLSWAAPFVDRGNAWPRPQRASDIVKVGDIIRIRQEDDERWSLGQIPELQGALVSVSPDNGDILALTGGYDFALSQVNRATTPRPPGSGFKPFVYGTALENGYTPATTINDAPFARGDYRPRNFENNFIGPVTLRNALANSRNIPAIRLYDQLGSELVLPFAKRFGFKTENFPRSDLTVALGSQDVQPLEMAIAFATIANGGQKVEPTLIKEIKTVDGNIPLPVQAVACGDQCDALPLNEMPAPRIVDPRVTYILASMMRSVIEEGSGRRVNREINRKDLMGKTGTTNGPAELWFSGFNRDIATSVFVGFDQPQPMGESEQGATVPVPIWIDYMKTVLEGTPEHGLDRPDGIVDRLIDKNTGKLARPGQGSTMFELFMQENAPTEMESSRSLPSQGIEDVPSIETIF